MISSLKEKAKFLGFISFGISRPEKPLYFDQFSKWIAAGRHGDLHWLEKHMEARENPVKLLEGCKTLISLAYPYSSIKPMTPDGFTSARYIEPQKINYHERLKELARRLSHVIHEYYPESKTRVCVDSAPILERSFACSSGIGFIGKNNSIIIPRYGSYVFLAEILTTASLPLSKTDYTENQCGSCTRCLDACPTGALENPFSLNASKCLSYLTIEHSGELEGSIGEKMGNCFLGCDACQEACPFNEKKLSRSVLLPSTDEFLQMEEKNFALRFGKTSLNRAGLEKIKRNIETIRSVFGK